MSDKRDNPDDRRDYLRMLDSLGLGLIKSAGAMSEKEFVDEIRSYGELSSKPSEDLLREWWMFARKRGFLTCSEGSPIEMRLTKDGNEGLVAAELIFNFSDLRKQSRSLALYVVPLIATATVSVAVAKNKVALYVVLVIGGMFGVLLFMIWALTKIADPAFSLLRHRQIDKAVRSLKGGQDVQGSGTDEP
jgi:hypothetical protein